MSKATKQKLIEAAIILFAQNDFNSLSVQTINDTAGVANKSALYYHFKSRWGLVEAALNHVLDPYVLESQTLLNALNPNQVSVANVVDALMKPMIKILLADNGYYALKFFSKTVSAGDEGRKLVAQKLTPIATLSTELLSKAIPGSNTDTIGIKVLFTFNSILNIISDSGLEKFWPTEVKDHRAIGLFLRDYIIGGISHNNTVSYLKTKK
ncbi:TetR/AcrR family transcriptional regulator [Acinetobacter haemolyticus]|uniref:TetR/AcrR family transcriptional regulator n=1 Tax=Acinetobacter TaxID=469 RepID=UPI001F3D3C8C|nr:TetR/AcrR family transcriptional regulator [Acinetobacter junii]